MADHFGNSHSMKAKEESEHNCFCGGLCKDGQAFRGVDAQAPLVRVYFSLLDNQIGEPPSQTLDCSHGVHNFLLAVDIGIQHTQNVLKAIVCHQRLHNQEFHTNLYKTHNSANMMILIVKIAETYLFQASSSGHWGSSLQNSCQYDSFQPL